MAEPSAVTPSPQQILDLPMQENDAEAATIREYLIALLAAVWTEQEGFSGKRPFGNSGWDGELEISLVRAGWVAGKVDADGYIEAVDSRAAHRLIASAIQALGASR